jgi:hypothetical protein
MNPSEELVRKFAELGPWIYQFQIDGQTCGGGISAVGDARVRQFFQFAPNSASILELGSLEGAHSFILAQHPGVSRVVAMEGREANLRKARFVQELLQIRNVDFIQGNLENEDLTTLGGFDAVFCCGLLYHLPQPWKLIAHVAKVAPILFIWTQYAAENEASDMANGLRGKTHIEGGPAEPLSGMSPTAIWLTLDSLRRVLRDSGYNKIEVVQDDPTHANGPAVTIGARRD